MGISRVGFVCSLIPVLQPHCGMVPPSPEGTEKQNWLQPPLSVAQPSSDRAVRREGGGGGRGKEDNMQFNAHSHR